MFDKNAREKDRTSPRTDAECCPQHCVARSSFCISLNIFKSKTPPKARSGGSQQQKQDAHFPAAQSRPPQPLPFRWSCPCHPLQHRSGPGEPRSSQHRQPLKSQLGLGAPPGCRLRLLVPILTARPSTVLIPCNIYGAFLSSSSEASANTAWQRRAARKEGVPRGSSTRTRTNHNITRLNNTVKNI